MVAYPPGVRSAPLGCRKPTAPAVLMQEKPATQITYWHRGMSAAGIPGHLLSWRTSPSSAHGASQGMRRSTPVPRPCASLVAPGCMRGCESALHSG